MPVAAATKPLDGQSLASIFQWLTTASHHDAMLPRQSAESVVESAHTFGPVEIANIGWAAGTPWHLGFVALEVLVNSAIRSNLNFAPQELASIARRLAVPNVPRKNLRAASLEAAHRALPHLDQRGVATLSWAFAVLIISGALLVNGTLERVQQLLTQSEAEWQAQSLASTVWFSSSSAVGGSLLIEELTKRSCLAAASFGITEAGSLSWSLSHSGRLDLCWMFLDELFVTHAVGIDRAALASAVIGPVLARYGLLEDAAGITKSLQALVAFGDIRSLADPALLTAGMALAELGHSSSAVDLLEQIQGPQTQALLAKACGVYIEMDPEQGGPTTLGLGTTSERRAADCQPSSCSWTGAGVRKRMELRDVHGQVRASSLGVNGCAAPHSCPSQATRSSGHRHGQ